LTLVDFGRAIDLSQYSHDGEDDVRNVLFSGSAVTQDMECVAMRSQQPWSYDVDTYGILGSAHVLLYGTHIEICQGKNGRWHPKTTLKRYWQQDIWKEIFETLLNLDDLGTAIGSRSSSLRSLRRKINFYLTSEGVEDRLVSLLKRQASMLPDSREKIS
jgi:checkpoint serine/threonine-protein kinase